MSPDATSSPNPINPDRAIEPKTPTRSEPGTEFQSYMQSSKAGAPGMAPTTGPSPLQAAAAANAQGAAPSFETLMTQSKTMQDTLGNLKNQLNTPNLKLNRSQTHLVRNKLSDANEYMQGAANKLGAEVPPKKAPKSAGAMERLMAYINDGQEKMVSVQQKLDELMGSGQEISPASMMMVQIKMSQAQQELEYSSGLLSKAVDALKQLFNIQL